jgi:hypothetical protein
VTEAQVESYANLRWILLPELDLMFLMGTIHRFPNQWLIVSLIYPPKPRALRLL